MRLTHFSQHQGVRLELAKPRDAEAIAILSRDLIEYGLGWSWTPDRVRKHIHLTCSMVVVARAEHRVQGFAITRFLDKTAHLDLLAVSESYQRKGIGQDLVNFVKSSATSIGIPVIFLELRETNEKGLAFYQALGYQEIKRIPGYYRGRETAVRMAAATGCQGGEVLFSLD